MITNVPDPSLILMIGVAGSGKSTFAKRHFKETQVLSSDFFRGMISDDPGNQTVNSETFAILERLARVRLSRGLLTVIDATNLQKSSRDNFIRLGKKFHIPRVAILLDVPLEECIRRDKKRTRMAGEEVIKRQYLQFEETSREVKNERFRRIIHLEGQNLIDNVVINPEPPRSMLVHEKGPFDIIGDVHGCYQEMVKLLKLAGYQVKSETEVIPPPGRKAIFLGDLVDRGPMIMQVLRLVMSMQKKGNALCLLGNHDWKLLRALRGNKVQVKHGLEDSLEQLKNEDDSFREEVKNFLEGLTTHYVLDDGKLVVAHGGLKESMHGRDSRGVHAFALYGDVTGRTDSYGLPIRGDWTSGYRGNARVIYGHVAVKSARWQNNTIDIDTGCVYGGSLTSIKYPEMEILSVKAEKTYYHRPAPLSDNC